MTISAISSPAFARLVAALKRRNKTCTVIESCCGGVINASILAQPGASAVYYGGSIAYNTRKAKPLLLNDEQLHSRLTTTHDTTLVESGKDRYIQSKLDWTRQTSLAFCEQMGTDLCIAEGGASGPTFRPEGLTTGFAAVAVAARDASTGNISVVQHEVIESTHANREANMRFFADQAALLALKAVQGEEEQEMPTTAQQPTERVDRATHLRTNVAALQSMADKAKYVVLYGSQSLLQPATTVGNDTDHDDGQHLHHRRLQFLSAAQVDDVCRTTGAAKVTAFLGLLNGHDPVFGVDLVDTSGDKEHLLARVLHEACGGAILEDTRSVAPLLSPHTAHRELALHATAMAQWQRRSAYCTLCGAPTALCDGGTRRECSSCQQPSWPRQDPSMIAAVSSWDGQRILLARSKRHPAKMHTAIAGFVEAGETMEQAVAREVYEETGIRVDPTTVRYIASQPWPFPQSTMIGFTVKADDTTQMLNIDTNELVEAAWFGKEQVRQAAAVRGAVMQKEVAEAVLRDNPRLHLLIPPQGVLARTLIDTWLDSS